MSTHRDDRLDCLGQPGGGCPACVAATDQLVAAIVDAESERLLFDRLAEAVATDE